MFSFITEDSLMEPVRVNNTDCEIEYSLLAFFVKLKRFWLV